MIRCSLLFLLLIVVSSIKAENPLVKNNSITIINKDYDLNGDTLKIPEGCVLKFEGGSISNGVISSNYSFPIEAGLSQIFNNVKLEIQKSGTVKLYSEWFGIDRRNNEIINSINLQSLLNCSKNLHVVFQDGLYRFSIHHPVKALGRFVLTGECSGSFSEVPRTRFSIIGYSNKPVFFLTLLTDRSTLKHISFSCSRGKNYKKFGNVGCIFIKDGINPGNIDSAIDECSFIHVGCPVKAYGRGLSVTNCRFQQCGGMVLKQTKSITNNKSQQPPFDGRGLFINNIRIHWLYQVGAGEYNSFGGKDKTFITMQENKEVDGSTFFGVMMDNIYADGECQLIDCKTNINSLILTNVFCAQPRDNFLHFRQNASNIIISKVISETFFQEPEKYASHFATFNGYLENLIMTDNIFGDVKEDIVKVCNDEQNILKNCIINNNIIKGGKGVLSLENIQGSSVRIINNIIEQTGIFEHEVRIHGDSRRTTLNDIIINN